MKSKGQGPPENPSHDGRDGAGGQKNGQPAAEGPRVKRICALLYRDHTALLPGLAALTAVFGPIDYLGGPNPFTLTGYYQQEMGGGLQKRLVAFARLSPPEDLVWAKLQTNALEALFSQEGKRFLNLDPGYLDSFKLVLASNKGRDNKMHLGAGVWADLQLVWQKSGYMPLAWTFPDYASGLYGEDLKAIKARFRGQIRACPPGDEEGRG